MRIRLLAVGQRLPAWMNDGFAEYARRLPHECRLELNEIPPGRRSGKTAPDRARQQEAERILKAIGNDRLIALDERGQSPDTVKLSAWLGDWLMDGRDLSLVIGGADGLDDSVLARAERRWSLSPLTLPHGLVRVVVAEQLYRAWSVRSGHPYHRA
ncbi:23S rRNA (pseudouridine(1915)-N(3))-methyltransferase RlmH [Natronospira bacteriovora]|uniref:Ribosomal RNA large subunit methyltransferase H n=1 Tax=Natronospira bacteriovora TaxID=3069753 RepID=A0ABU0W7I9_9GAMM|nr:23S rRNA (pseudouridine(1915)-N(3))-methyltransferase RlmH [Natronospira sp. AB-CW4]MDQ2069961.1 23S rRNA (pseudouridine(1915)-N(3))-methyltransferase RlmH [Natronospira sp. AB-CW4]